MKGAEKINSPTRNSVISGSTLSAPSALKITDLKDFHKLTNSGTVSQSSSNNSLSKSSSFEDPFDHDNISYSNQQQQQNNNTTTTSIVCDRLPEPTEFGDGNPFLMFICLSCLLQHRNQIMNGRFDYQEVAMFFDKMVRKHDVVKTLNLARKLFAEYLNDDWATTSNLTNGEEESKTNC